MHGKNDIVKCGHKELDVHVDANLGQKQEGDLTIFM